MTTYNDDPRLTDDFFDTSEMDQLDKQISDLIGRPTLVDQMTDRSEEESSKRTRWANEFKQYWYVYIFLVISGLFTAMLGIYMGMSPTLENAPDPITGIIRESIHWNTDFGHVVLAIVYLITFVGVTEFQFAVAKHKFHTREEANGTQAWTMFTGMVIGFVGIIGTGIAGGSIVASNIAFMTEFKEIPPSAQAWVVKAIPVLLAIYAVLYTAYALSSGAAKAERLTTENKRKQKLDHETRITAIEQIAERQLQVAEIQVYKRLVMTGRMSRAEAMAAIRAGHTLAQTEVNLGRDLDNDQKIGNVPTSRPDPKPASQPTPLPQADPYIPYTYDQLLTALGMTVPEAYQLIQKHQLLTAGKAFMEFQKYGLLPADLEYLNFANLYNRLMQEGARANGAAVNP